MNNVIRKEKEINDKIAAGKAALHDRASMRALLKQQYGTIKPHIKKSKSLLEIGSGTGEFAVYATTALALKQFIGIDVSAECVKIAQEKLSSHGKIKVDFFEGDAAQTHKIVQKNNAQKPDTVLMRGVVHHLEDPANVFKSVHTALDDGGRLVIFEGNKSSLYRSMVLGVADLFGIEHEASQFEHTPPEKIKTCLQEIGFRNIKIEYVPGLVAPFAYLGKGTKKTWDKAMIFNEKVGRAAPKIFGWWYLLTAEK